MMGDNHATADIQAVLVRELRAFEREVAAFPDDVLLWKTIPGITNSVGNLAWHVCGNLQHYVGRGLGRTGYVRDRDLEFSRRSGTREELIREIRGTIAVIERVLPALGADLLARDYPEPLYGLTMKTGRFLHHLVTHLAHHLGQAGYLRRVVTGENRSTDPISFKELAGEG